MSILEKIEVIIKLKTEYEQLKKRKELTEHLINSITNNINTKENEIREYRDNIETEQVELENLNHRMNVVLSDLEGKFKEKL